MTRILLADDEEENIKLMKIFCNRMGWETLEAKDGKEAVAKAVKNNPNIILLDIRMPELDGLQVIDILKKNEDTQHIPIILLTALGAKENILEGISKGADDYLIKPVDLTELALRIKNHLKINEYNEYLKNNEVLLQRVVAAKTRDLKNALDERNAMYVKLQEGYVETVQRLALVAEYKDEDTAAHIRRIGSYAKMISEMLGMDREFMENIFHAAPMHDIGKVGIPESILLKTGSLDAREWVIVKSHTVIGARILSGSRSSLIKMAESIAFSHHEKWDGTGYPEGVKGEGIPLSARITTMADIYDALRNKRPYKPGLDHEEACRIIVEGDDRTRPEHFDPQIFELFKRSRHKLEEIYRTEK
ncbi:MAG: response regulator [Candidatus Tantalella remota]|nr:response regulator [Candidatus Tantalella remota]